MRFLLPVFGLLFPCSLFAAVQAGVGLSSTTSGRTIPGLEFGLGGDRWRTTVNAIGVSTSYYYHSSYTLGLFRTWKAGPLLWGDVESGLGGGMMYSVRGFQDEGSADEEKKSDFVFGPAFFLQWYLAGPAYLKLDMVWGVRGLSPLLGLNGQDVIFLSLGVRAW